MRTIRSTFVIGLALLGLAAGACSDDDGEPLFRDTVETKELTVGGGGPDQIVRLGRGHVVEIVIPGNVVPTRASVSVSLVTGVVKRGEVPVNDYGVLVDPQGLTFAQPVRVRQVVPAPPAGRHYVAVVVPDRGRTFVARAPARRLSTVDPTGLESGELWEGDGDGSGLWGLGYADGPVPDGGDATAIDGAAQAGVDAGTRDGGADGG